MRVAFVAPVCMNPKQKKYEDERRRKKRSRAFEDKLEETLNRELPEDSTVSYYV